MAGMTKEDRAEYETRLAACGYWERLSHENALNYGLTSKRDFLNRKRAEEAEAMAQAETAKEETATESVEPTENPFAVAIAQASEAFGKETVEAFLACPSRDRFAFVQSLFNSNPIAACILYAIDESVINANDDHGFYTFSSEWLDCFAATLDCWLDDWSMIAHSGIARIDWEIWQEIGNRIHAYHRGELQTVETLAEIKLHFCDVELLLAEDDFRANPTESNKIALLEIAEIRFAAYRARILEIYSNAKEAN